MRVEKLQYQHSVAVMEYRGDRGGDFFFIEDRGD